MFALKCGLLLPPHTHTESKRFRKRNDTKKREGKARKTSNAANTIAFSRERKTFQLRSEITAWQFLAAERERKEGVRWGCNAFKLRSIYESQESKFYYCWCCCCFVHEKPKNNVISWFLHSAISFAGVVVYWCWSTVLIWLFQKCTHALSKTEKWKNKRANKHRRGIARERESEKKLAVRTRAFSMPWLRWYISSDSWLFTT